MRFLAELGLWEGLARKAAPLRKLRIIDDTGNLFRWPELCFEAGEIGLDAFGWNIGADVLVRALREAVARKAAIRLIEGQAKAPLFGAAPSSDIRGSRRAGKAPGSFADGDPENDVGQACLASVEVGGARLDAPLIVAADGQRSQLREAAGISTRVERLPQQALIALLRHELPHEDASTEFHKRGGPCTLVPFALGEAEAGGGTRGSGELPYASSLVWMMEAEAAAEMRALDDESFALALERAVHSMLGKMRVLGQRGAVPLSSLHPTRVVAPRLALVGEAAHAFPPIGAQGLNLGLRDAAALAALVGETLEQGGDIGGAALLDAYDRGRRADISTRSAAVGLMNRSLLSGFLPADMARGLGMAALDLIGPLRRFVMRQGIEPGLGRKRA